MNKHDAWLEAPYDLAAIYADRFERLLKEIELQLEKDCTEAILAADENRVTSALIDIGNRARQLRNTGDTDEKLELIDRVCQFIDLIIIDYALAEAELAIGRGE